MAKKRDENGALTVVVILLGLHMATFAFICMGLEAVVEAIPAVLIDAVASTMDPFMLWWRWGIRM